VWKAIELGKTFLKDKNILGECKGNKKKRKKETKVNTTTTKFLVMKLSYKNTTLNPPYKIVSFTSHEGIIAVTAVQVI
jgi:hypothetical protein